VEERRIDEFLVQPLAPVHLAHHELATEAVLLSDRLDEVFLVKGLEKLGVVRIDRPVLAQTLDQRLGHVLEVAPHVEIIQCDTILTHQIKVIEDEVLRLQLQLDTLEPIVQQQSLLALG